MSINLFDYMERRGIPIPGFDGRARQQQWECEDGYLITYCPGRAEGGPHHGKFVVMMHRPKGPGARTGKARLWERTYFRGFAVRKTARARAEQLYWRHNPKRAAHHGVKVT